MGPERPKSLLEEAGSELSHPGRGDLARSGEGRVWDTHMKEIRKGGPANWDRARGGGRGGRGGGGGGGGGEPQKDALKMMLVCWIPKACQVHR